MSKRLNQHRVFAVLAVTILLSIDAAAQSSISGTGGSVTTVASGTTGVSANATSGSPDVSVKTGDAASSTFRVLNSSNTELLRVQANGKVGIGTASPAEALHVIGNIRLPFGNGIGIGAAAPSGYPFYAFSNTVTTATGFKLESSYSGAGSSYVVDVGEYGTYLSHNRDPQNGDFVNNAASPAQGNAVQLTIGDTRRNRLFQVVNFPGGTETPRFVVDFNGRVGIGTPATEDLTAKLKVVGDVVVSGSITGASVIGAVYQDVAEWVPAATDLVPGTVVALNPEKNNQVMAANTPYDTMVAGVVSEQPGVILGKPSPSKEMIATTGRVMVRVSASNGPIRVGDLLVSSDESGTAMKSQPIDVAGVKIHRPGTLIGKALEPLNGGTGTILVLLSLQ